jgi:S-adenosylmethionine:tRNA ribosyltransferase-isomerase
MNSDQQLSSYHYELPRELIAQNPVIPRDSSRLLVIDSPSTHKHTIFTNLPDWLLPGDLLVLNNTRVIPARLYGQKSTGAEVEILLVEEKQDNCWLALVKPGKRFSLGSEIYFSSLGGDQMESFKAVVIDHDPETGGRILRFEVPKNLSFWDCLEKLGEIPFPPYVNDSMAQPDQYQTIFAEKLGAIAAPTAGLHFTPRLLKRLKAGKVNLAYITLHVGIGTFRPVEVEDVTTHIMHQEWIEVNQNTVDLIKQTKLNGGRVIAVGTTVVRALEGAFAKNQEQNRQNLSNSGDFINISGNRANNSQKIADLINNFTPFRGKTNLFIYPGYNYQVIDGLITNFHLPCSSLLMLVSALIGRERLLSLYQEAIREKYRFYSFGDAMFIHPSAILG